MVFSEILAGKEAIFLKDDQKASGSPGAEQRVAAFFAERGPEGILRLSLSEIASACSVSCASVVRHCRREGYQGLKEYKISKASDSGISSSPSFIRGNEPLPELKRNLFAGCVQALQRTSDLLSMDEMKRAVRSVAACSNLDVYACGGSISTASFLRHQLIKLGIRTNVYSDRSSMLLSQSRLSARDVVIAISSSGITRDVVDAQRGAHAAGAITICLTAVPDSPLASVSDIVLLAAGDTFLGNNTFSRLSQLAVVDLLYAALAGPQNS